MPTNAERYAGPLYNRWISALKSGEFPKGRKFLNHGDQYCCLGVACALFGDQVRVSTSLNHHNVTEYDGHAAILPPAIVDLLGLKTNEGMFDVNDLPFHLEHRLAQLDLGGTGKVNLTAINDRTDDFDLIIEILEELPPSIFA